MADILYSGSGHSELFKEWKSEIRKRDGEQGAIKRRVIHIIKEDLKNLKEENIK